MCFFSSLHTLYFCGLNPRVGKISSQDTDLNVLDNTKSLSIDYPGIWRILGEYNNYVYVFVSVIPFTERVTGF